MTEDPIAEAYARRIKRPNSTITIEDVPEEKREAVRDILEAEEK